MDEQITNEEAARSLRPNTAWYATQVYSALKAWEEDCPGLLEKHWPHFNVIQAMGSILDGLEWF